MKQCIDDQIMTCFTDTSENVCSQTVKIIGNECRSAVKFIALPQYILGLGSNLKTVILHLTSCLYGSLMLNNVEMCFCPLLYSSRKNA